LLLLLLPVLRRDSLDIEGVAFGISFSSDKDLDIESSYSFCEGELLKIKPSIILFQLRKLKTCFILSTRP
jgi:hypothetical protein